MPHSDGHDAPWLIDEFVPSEAAVVDDVIVRFEYPVREPVGTSMFSVMCADLDQVENALCTIRAMVLQGDFDNQLAKASERILTNFSIILQVLTKVTKKTRSETELRILNVVIVASSQANNSSRYDARRQLRWPVERQL